MTAVDRETTSQPPPVDDPTGGRPAIGMCPYLAAADGSWRSTTVAREHRCGAVAPPAPLTAEKQRRLCLTDQFTTCATFEAARATRPVAHERAPTLPRPLARTTPVVLDHGRLSITIPALRTDRSNGQAALIALMVLAFAAIVLAKLGGGGVPAGAIDLSASPRSSVLPSTDAPPTASGDPGAGPTEPAVTPEPTLGGETAAPTSKPTKAPQARTYTVQPGDTLIGIAAKYGTTTRAISKLNGITDPSSLKIGQVLKIP